MNVKNKLESNFMLQKLNINRIEERIFNKTQINDIINYLKTSNCETYMIRDKSNSMGKFRIGLTAEEVLKYINEYNIFSISDSMIEARDNHTILNGSIQITKDWVCRASLKDENGFTVRDVENNPKYKLSYNIIDDPEPPILGLKQVIDYYIQHEFFDLVMEFGLYDITVGINKENLIIWEIRNY